MIVDLDLALAEIAANDWRVNNLFERPDGQWQCNLAARDGLAYAGWGIGPSPAEAISRAMDEMLERPQVRVPREITGCVAPTPDLSTILGRQKPKLIRRPL